MPGLFSFGASAMGVGTGRGRTGGRTNFPERMSAVLEFPSTAQTAEPVRIDFFAHADTSVSEARLHRSVRGDFMFMDRTRPVSEIPKSAGLTNLGIAPSRRCVGSPFFPVWSGEVGGRITGEVVFEFYVVSSPGGEVDVRLWPDVDVTECEDHYRTPAARTTVNLPFGSGKVVARMTGVDFEAANNVIVQLSPKAEITQGRVLFDATSAPTSLTLHCTPLWEDGCAPYDD